MKVNAEEEEEEEVTLSHRMYLRNGFRKSAPLQNRRMIVYHFWLKRYVDDFVGKSTFKTIRLMHPMRWNRSVWTGRAGSGLKSPTRRLYTPDRGTNLKDSGTKRFITGWQCWPLKTRALHTELILATFPKTLAWWVVGASGSYFDGQMSSARPCRAGAGREQSVRQHLRLIVSAQLTI